MKQSIFIVDDVATNIKLAASVLRNEGYRLLFAGNGREALAQIPKYMPDLILLDIMMPDIDGIQVCNELKKEKETAQIPVIFLTAKNDPKCVTQAFHAGGVDYITKPFNNEELLARVRTHLELKRQRDELKSLNETKDRLFSIISHDLKNPFGNALSFSELLEKNIDKYPLQKIKQNVEFIHTSIQMGYNLLENLLQWSRSQIGHIPYSPEEIDASHIIGATVMMTKHIAEKKEINISSPTIEGIKVFADKNMLQTIIRNLVSNAIKFTSANGKIIILANETSENTEIIVSDTGIGIKPESLKKLFKIENPCATTGTGGEQGTGLGLVLCKELIEKNNGTLTVESTPDIGSDFKITLPKRKS